MGALYTIAKWFDFRNNNFLAWVGIGLFTLFFLIILLRVILRKNWKKSLYFGVASLTSYFIAWATLYMFGAQLIFLIFNSIVPKNNPIYTFLIGDGSTSKNLISGVIIANPLFALLWWVCIIIVWWLVTRILWLFVFRKIFTIKINTKKNNKQGKLLSLPGKISLVVVCVICYIPNLFLFTTTASSITANYNVVKSNAVTNTFESLNNPKPLFFQPTDFRYTLDCINSYAENFDANTDFKNIIDLDSIKQLCNFSDIFNVSNIFGGFFDQLNADNSNFTNQFSIDGIIQAINDDSQASSVNEFKDTLKTQLTTNVNTTISTLEGLITVGSSTNIIDSIYSTIEDYFTSSDGSGQPLFVQVGSSSKYTSTINTIFSKQLKVISICKFLSKVFLPEFMEKTATLLLNNSSFLSLEDLFGTDFKAINDINIPINMTEVNNLQNKINQSNIGSKLSSLKTLLNDIIVNTINNCSGSTVPEVVQNLTNGVDGFSSNINEKMAIELGDIVNIAIGIFNDVQNGNLNLCDFVIDFFDSSKGITFGNNTYYFDSTDDQNSRIHISNDLFNSIKNFFYKTLTSKNNQQYTQGDKDKCNNLVTSVLNGVFYKNDRSKTLDWVY